MKNLHQIAAIALFWFGIIMAIFAFTTEISQQQIYLSSDFYFEMSLASFLASIAVASVHRMEK